jgi:hypothetical protein
MLVSGSRPYELPFTSVVPQSDTAAAKYCTLARCHAHAGPLLLTSKYYCLVGSTMSEGSCWYVTAMA